MRGAPIFGMIAAAAAFPSHGVQRRIKKSPDPKKADAVVEAFRASWNGYYKNAFPSDTLRPLSRVGVNDR